MTKEKKALFEVSPGLNVIYYRKNGDLVEYRRSYLLLFLLFMVGLIIGGLIAYHHHLYPPLYCVANFVTANQSLNVVCTP